MGDRPQEDGIIRFGNLISLKHNQTGRFLTSAPEFYEGGSQQQIVFAGEWQASDDSTWVVGPPMFEGEEAGPEVSWGSRISLKHLTTRCNLHSHCEHESPITQQQEVTCFGSDEESDDNDVWFVTPWEEGEGDEFWRVGQGFLLTHAATGRTLHSHDMEFFQGNEVTGFPDERDENDKWRVEW